MLQQNQRNIIIDSFKGLAIIAVALYHYGAIILPLSYDGGLTLENGLLPFGYLGVDIFFVISGYFLIKGLFYSFVNRNFNYFNFIFHKIIRLWPLVLLVSSIALIFGFFLMLPDDYENLAESVVASVFFSNNILACITTKNYWDIVNLYKPLMHLWYIGILMKAYIVMPLFYLLCFKFYNSKNIKHSMIIGSYVLTVVSFVLFVMPFSSAWKFYYLPFRIFEITIGGLVFLSTKELPDGLRRKVFLVAIAVLLCMIFTRNIIIYKSFMLLVVVIATAALLFCSDVIQVHGVFEPFFKLIASIGERSYSIYIWHQFVIAFLFYSVFVKLDIVGFPVFVLLTVFLSLLSYHYLEKKMVQVIENNHKVFFTVSSIAVAILLCGISLSLYFHAGVVRDVPELEINKNNVHRHMHAEYCDRPYKWDKDFSKPGTTRILVLGNSFGRDWANILYEYDKGLDISYVHYTEKNVLERLDRIKTADRVFYAMGPGYGSVPEIITKTVSLNKLYIIGNKNYGESNGIIYARRGLDDYYLQTVSVPFELKEQNKMEALHWKNHYVDMIAPVSKGDGSIQVFTDNKKFISQDCRHLTEAGAKYYARILNIKNLLVKENEYTP